MGISIFAAASAATLLFTAVTAGDPPIVKPGAPGEPGTVLTPEESAALGATSVTAADARFMQHMIVHHGQAVDMVAMIADRTTNQGVRDIGERISLSQDVEIQFMQRWLETRGYPTEDPHLGHGDHGDHGGDHDGHDMHGGHHDHKDHGDHSDHDGADHDSGHHGDHDHHDKGMKDPLDVAVMPGMLTPRQMQTLEASTGETFDRLFLEGMIFHHEGAIDMVTGLMRNEANGQDPELSEFLGSVVSDQSAEILRMNSLLAGIAKGE